MISSSHERLREVVNVLRRAVLTSASKFLFRLDDFISDRVSQTSKVSSDWHGGFCLLSEGEQVEVLMTGCERLFFMGGRVLAHPSTSNLSELRMNSIVIKWFSLSEHHLISLTMNCESFKRWWSVCRVCSSVWNIKSVSSTLCWNN